LSPSTEPEISNCNERDLRQLGVSVNGVIHCRRHNRLRHSVAPGGASHELRKGLLLVWGNQDLWLLPRGASDRQPLGVMTGAQR
jgi:hypothetical protein